MFDLEKYFDKELTKNELAEGIELYKKSIADFPFPKLNSDTTFEKIKEIKRDKFQIGPYSGLSIFEISNRLFSDLIILDGAMQLFDDPFIMNAKKVETVKLILSNKAGFDLVIKTDKGIVHGEGFNVAPSFFKQKLRATIKKFKKADNVENAIIIFNEDAIEDEGVEMGFLSDQMVNCDKILACVYCKLDEWKK